MSRLLVLLAFYTFVGCSHNDPVHDLQNAQIDSFLKLGENDSLSIDERLAYSDRAFVFIKDQPNDSLKLVNLFKVANRYFNLMDVEKYGNVSRLLVSLSSVGKDSAKIGKAYQYLADYYTWQNKRPLQDSALYCLVKAQRYYERVLDREQLILILYGKASILFNEKDYYGSESTAFYALDQLNYINNSPYKYNFYVLLSNISHELKDYGKAIEYLNKAKEIALLYDLKDAFQPCVLLNNFGHIYQNKGNNYLAIRMFKQALTDKLLPKNHPLLYAVLLDNLAYSRFKIGETNQEIIGLFNKSIAIKDSLGNIPELVFSKTRLSELHYMNRDTTTAIALNNSALIDSEGEPITQLIPLQKLIKFDESNSIKHAKAYIAIKDSLQIAERKTQNKFARIQYETDEFKEEKDAAVKHKYIILWTAFVLLLIGTLLFVFRIQRANQKEMRLVQQQQSANEEIYSLMLHQQRTIEEVRQKEKQRIGKDLHDGVMNKLASTRLNLFVLNKKSDPETVKECLPYISGIQEIEKEIRNIAHDLNTEVFAKQDSFKIIVESLFKEQVAISEAACHLASDADINWEVIGSTVKINIYRILQEAFQNINKHARATHVVVNIIKQRNKLLIEISDDGVGFNKRKKTDGIGLSNIISRAKLIGGKIEITSRRTVGTKIKLLIPI